MTIATYLHWTVCFVLVTCYCRVILLFVVHDYNLVLYDSYYVFLDIHDEEFPNIEALK